MSNIADTLEKEMLNWKKKQALLTNQKNNLCSYCHTKAKETTVKCHNCGAPKE